MIKLLIVDDERIEREYLCGVFSRRLERYSVAGQAENGDQAVAMALQLRPDVIILDINLPVLDGLEAARRIRRRLPEQIIILNSAYAEFEFARQALTEHLDAYLLKPTPEEAIFAAIEDCLQRRKRRAPLPERRNAGEETLSRERAGKLLQAVAEGNPSALKLSAEAFMDFLKKQDNLEELRLYVINTLFSVERGLTRNHFSEERLALLDCGQAIFQLSRCGFWQELCAVCENFFHKLLLLFDQPLAPAGDAAAKAARYIDGSYMKDFDLNELARSVNLSPAYLSRLFHSSMGLTLRSYLTKVRIAQAQRLLQNTDRALRDVAGDCGFVNLSHFHRVFKQATGKTPSQARREGRREN